jgi:hypothetical protein
VADAIRIHLGPKPLCDDVDEVILEILGDAGNEGDAHCQEKQLARAGDELSRRIVAEAGRVIVDDVAEDQRIE